MRASRRGFTLIELMIGLLLMTLIGTVIFKLLQSEQRVSTAQAERMMLQASVRTGALVVPTELRELSTNAGGRPTWCRSPPTRSPIGRPGAWASPVR